MMRILSVFLLISLAFAGFGFADVVFENSGAAFAAQDGTQGSFVQTAPYDSESLKTSINNALAQYLPDAELLDLKETTVNGKTLCVCKVSYRGTTLNLTIDPTTGKVKGNFGTNSKDEKGENVTSDAPNMAVNSAAVRVSTKQVNDTLEQILPGASISRTHYNKKDGTIEGFVSYQNFKYYFKINAQTGEIITMQPAGGN